MKNLVFIVCMLALVSCGKRRETIIEKTGKAGSSCTVEETNYGAEITCDDGTGATLTNGNDGAGCTIEDAVNGALITCGDTKQVVYDGQNGKDGIDGQNGTDGVDGQDGSDGQDAEFTSDTIVQIIDPCGDNEGELDEVLLITQGGSVIAYFEDGGKRFLSSLEPGNYETTDKQKCDFTVNSDFSILY